MRLGDTPFGTNFTMLERMQKVKIQIQQMEISFNEKQSSQNCEMCTFK